MFKNTYIIKGECDGVVKIMGAIALTKEQFEKRNEDKKLEEIGNDLLNDEFQRGYRIETLEECRREIPYTDNDSIMGYCGEVFYPESDTSIIKEGKVFTDGDIKDFVTIYSGSKESMDHAFDSIKGFLIFHSMHNECFIHKGQ